MKSILIVDDQSDVRLQIRMLLAEAGLLPGEVYEAATVASATALACAHRPSLMLLDVVLPDGTGFEVMRVLREKGCCPKTIMMTAFPQFDYALQAVNSQVLGFLVKPLEIHEFSRVLMAAQGAEYEQKQRHLAFTMLDVYLKGQQFNMQLEEMRESTGINRLRGAYYLALIVSLECSVTLENRIMQFWALLRDANMDSVNYLQDTATMVVLLRSNEPKRLLPRLEEKLKTAFGGFTAGCAFPNAENGLRFAYQNAAFALEYARAIPLNDQIVAYATLDVARILIDRQRSGLLTGESAAADRLMVELARQNVSPAQATRALQVFCAQEGLPPLAEGALSLKQVGAALAESVKGGRKAEEGKKNFAQLARVKQYIAAHCAENINRASIVQDLGISYSYVGELFRNEMNISVTEYITNLKMQRATELLASSRLNIGEIARLVGYSDSRSFIRVFLKRYGVTPGEWRLQKKENKP